MFLLSCPSIQILFSGQLSPSSGNPFIPPLLKFSSILVSLVLLQGGDLRKTETTSYSSSDVPQCPAHKYVLIDLFIDAQQSRESWVKE